MNIYIYFFLLNKTYIYIYIYIFCLLLKLISYDLSRCVSVLAILQVFVVLKGKTAKCIYICSIYINVINVQLSKKLNQASRERVSHRNSHTLDTDLQSPNSKKAKMRLQPQQLQPQTQPQHHYQQQQQQQQLQQQQPPPPPPPPQAEDTAPATTSSSPPPSEEAPPKQVAQAMDRLSHAARLIADIRLGADRLLEALFIAAQPHQSNKPLHLFLKEDSSMRQHLQDLRSVGNARIFIFFSCFLGLGLGLGFRRF